MKIENFRLGRWAGAAVAVVLLAIGLFRLRFDVEVLDLLPQQLKTVQGLKLYQEHFANARELIITVHGKDSEATENAARAIAEELRWETNLVTGALWQPPWLEHAGQAAELIGYLWLNQPPQALQELAERLKPEKLAAELARTREELATSMSPAEIGRSSYDPFGFTRLPESATGAAPSFGQGQEMFVSEDGTFRLIYLQARPELRTYKECARWLEAIKSRVGAALEINQTSNLKPQASGKPQASSVKETSIVEARPSTLDPRPSIGFTGRPAFVAEVAMGMERDITTSVGGTSVIIAGLFWLAHRRWKPMLWLLTLLALILGATLALGGLIFGTISVISMGFAAILLGLAVDYAVVHYQEAVAHPDLSVPEIRHAIAPSIFWAAVTSISAFIVLNFGGLPGLGQLGSLVGLGIGISACVMIYAFLPPLFPDRRRRKALSTNLQAPEKLQPPSSKETSTFERSFPSPRPSPQGEGESSPARGAIGAAFVTTCLVLAFCVVVLSFGLPKMDRSANALRPRNSASYAALEDVKTYVNKKREPLWLLVGGKSENEVAQKLEGVTPVLSQAVSNGVIGEFALPTALWPRPEFQQANRAVAMELAGRERTFREAASTNGFAESALGLMDGVLRTFREASAIYGTFWPTNEMSRWIFQKVVARAGTNYFALGFLNPREGETSSGKTQASEKSQTPKSKSRENFNQANSKEALNIEESSPSDLPVGHQPSPPGRGRIVASPNANGSQVSSNDEDIMKMQRRKSNLEPRTSTLEAKGAKEETVETVRATRTGEATPLKRGVNEIATLEGRLPKDGVWLSGWELLGGSIFSSVKRNMWKLVGPMVGLVLLSLWLAFRGGREVWLSLAVLAMSGLCLLTVMRLGGWSWNLLNLMALPLILGTGVDYSIFMQLALRRYRGDLGMAYRSVGRALLLCGATAIAGFGSLAWSSNAGMASLGAVCAVGIAGNMLIAVLLLPRWWKASSFNPQASGKFQTTKKASNIEDLRVGCRMSNAEGSSPSPRPSPQGEGESLAVGSAINTKLQGGSSRETSDNAEVGRVTPCAPARATEFSSGAHGVTRPTSAGMGPGGPSVLYCAMVWQVGLAVARILPERVCVGIGKWLAGIYWGAARVRREVVIENLMPAVNNDRAVAKQKARELFEQFAIKLVDLWRFESGSSVEDMFVEYSGWQHFLEARATKRGILLVTPHLGNWEFGGPALSHKGIALQVITLAEPGRNFTKLRQESRARQNIETIVIGDDPFVFVEIIRRLEGGAVVALLVDRPSAPTAVTVELFGKPFPASIAAAELARASGCIVMPVYMLRSDKGYGAHILPAVNYNRAGLRDRAARQRLTQQIMSALEPVIRKHVEQWYHFVNVWRRNDE